MTTRSSSFPGSPGLTGLDTDDGTTWAEFRRGLQPDYRRVWVDLTFCTAMLLVGVSFLVLGSARLALGPAIACTIVASVWCGFWLHAISLFGHESAHFGLSASRERNDRIADLVVWPWFGQTTKTYRRFHWEHHRHLGDPLDTEVSYHQCLSTGFVMRMLTGMTLLEAVTRYGADDDAKKGGSPITKASAARTAVLHLVIVTLPLFWGLPLVSLGWIGAVVVVFPALNTLRQLLEHRPESAACTDDVSLDPFGPETRCFERTLVSRWFGAAGFADHMLHHWDPSVSYTNLGEMEGFLRQAGLGESIDDATTTYRHECRVQLKAARAT